MERSCTDIHHGIINLATLRTLASRSGNPSERGCPTGRLRGPEAGTLCDHLSRGRVKSQSFPGNRWVVLPGVERLRKCPKSAFHRATTAIPWERQSPCCRAIMEQLSIGGGVHTFLRRALLGIRLKGKLVAATWGDPCGQCFTSCSQVLGRDYEAF